MMNKNSSGRLIVIEGEVDDDGKYSIKEANTKSLVLFGVMNSRSYSCIKKYTWQHDLGQGDGSRDNTWGWNRPQLKFGS